MRRWSDKLNRETRTGTRGGKSEEEKAKRRKRKRVRAEEGVRCKGCGAEGEGETALRAPRVAAFASARGQRSSTFALECPW